ncbi:hypothetical protein PCK2_000802 [Pneumocystis canis]|nr:hypothetical protein PCK2_000802 [Pneumocystis canis]
MKSLFPSPPSLIQIWIEPYLNSLNMSALSKHFHVVIGASLFYQFLFIISPFVSRKLTVSYLALNTSTRIKWDVHFVSMVQSILISYLVLRCWKDDELKQDKLFGYNAYRGGRIFILWLVVIFSGIRSFHFVISHYSALLCACMKPFLMYYGTSFLAFEFSTPFLNLDWFFVCLKNNLGFNIKSMAGGLCQLINGIIFITNYLLIYFLI